MKINEKQNRKNKAKEQKVNKGKVKNRCSGHGISLFTFCSFDEVSQVMLQYSGKLGDNHLE